MTTHIEVNEGSIDASRNLSSEKESFIIQIESTCKDEKRESRHVNCVILGSKLEQKILYVLHDFAERSLVHY